MLDFTIWASQAHQTPPHGIFYAFLPGMTGPSLTGKNLYMTSVGVSSEDLQVLNSVSEGSEWIFPKQEIIRILVDKFKQVPQVESICAQFGSDEVTIWTILETYNPEARSTIHGKELEICRMLNVFDFDFRVTSADTVSPAELLGNGLFEIYNRSRSSSG